MDRPLRRPEEILAYRSLRQILAAKPKSLWSVGPGDTALAAMRLMAEKNIGFLVVIVRLMVPATRTSEATVKSAPAVPAAG